MVCEFALLEKRWGVNIQPILEQQPTIDNPLSLIPVKIYKYLEVYRHLILVYQETDSRFVCVHCHCRQ